MFFWNSLAFSMIQRMLAIWSLVPLPFLKPAWTSGVHGSHILKPGLENFEHYFTGMWDECNCVVVWAFFGIAFLWEWDENWPFPVLWPLLCFPTDIAYNVVNVLYINYTSYYQCYYNFAPHPNHRSSFANLIKVGPLIGACLNFS